METEQENECVSIDDLMSEAEVLEKYGQRFVDKELLQARKEGLIEYHDLRKGKHYTKAGLSAYLNQKRVLPCPRNPPLIVPEDGANENKPVFSNMDSNGSTGKKKTAHGSDIGMTQES